ncbi:unnamed protein product [Closterium sp. NIES-53]
MRLRFGSGDLGRLSATCLETSCPPRAVPCVFLGFPPDAPGWQFYHPSSRRVLSSQDVTFDESVPYYHLFPYRTAPLPPSPLFLAPGPPPVDPLPPQGPALSGVSQVDAVEPVKVAVDSGAARGAEPAGAGSGGAEPEGAEPRGAEFRGAEPGGAESGGAEPGGAEPRGAEPRGAGSARVASGGASLRREVLSPRELREWFARRWSRAAGAGGAPATTGSGGSGPGGAGATGPGGAAEAAGVGPTGGSAGVSGGTGAAGSAGPAAAGATGVGAAGGVGAGGSAGAGTSEGAGAGATGAGGATGVGAPTGSPGAVPAGSGGALRPRPYFVPLLEQYSSLQPTPPPTGHSLSAQPSDESVEPSRLYPEFVGCLMYLMTCTRPDLTYPLSLLARYVAPSRHRKVHWDAVKRVLRYLCSASGMGLVLGGQGSVVLTGHFDASWADDQVTQCSSQGYTFSLGSGSVSWRSTRSSSVLGSSCEAEIYTGAMAA